MYEYTISFLYERLHFKEDYDSITIMDGNFFSLFPRDINKNLYSLTHVKYSPFTKNNDFKKLNKNITEEEIININENIKKDILKYLPQFNKTYILKSHFISYKCKKISNNSTRDCIIEHNNNIISVNCGKIIGIFQLEKYLKKINLLLI